jgi:hypothetical protein
MAPELRPRTRKVAPESYATALESARSPSPAVSELSTPTASVGAKPPIYTIDLSLPPRQRYIEVVRDHRACIRILPCLFDDLIDAVKFPKRLVHLIARMSLRRVFSKEQTEELRGISETACIPMYLLVAYNVLLDLFMGCTSGGMRVQPSDNEEPTMMHFRTLDWDMPELRSVVVQFDYVSRPGGEVIARTMGYVGFVGVLTGLRKDLSISMNFRPYHNNDTSMLANLKFYYQQLAVLLGFRPSLASVLRDFILPRSTHMTTGKKSEKKVEARTHYGYDDITTTLPTIPSTAAYLIFCTPDQTILLEKDRKEAKIMTSSEFWTTTNHDVLYEQQQNADHDHAAHAAYAKTAFGGLGMEEVVEESIERKRCMMNKWERWNRRHGGRYTKKRMKGNSDETIKKSVPLGELKRWMVEDPISNEQTHFACIMDPKEVVFRWARKYYEGEIGDSDDDVTDARGESKTGSPCRHGKIAGCCRPL